MLSEKDKKTLIKLAKESIAYGLKHQNSLPITISDYSEFLQQNGASFVTLTLHGDLCGCIGSLHAYRPLIEDVVKNAYAAAFHDIRFNPLLESEYEDLEYHLSVLKPAEDFPVNSEEDLLQQLRPYQDGLILEEGLHVATFLPSVWKSLPEAKDFLLHLKHKAGLSADYWSESLKFKRYEVEEFS